MRVLVVLIAVAAACGKSKQQCKADVADVSAYLATLDTGGRFGASTAKLATREDLPAQPDRPMAGFDQLAFAFARTTTAKRPPRTAVDDHMDKLARDGAGNAVELAHEMQDLIGSCKSFQKLFGQLANVEGLNKGQVLVAGIPQA